MMVVDAHLHFWDPGKLRYPWLDGVPELRRPFFPRDYPGEADAVVFVEANPAPGTSADEIAFVERLAANEPRIAGIVAYVDLVDEAQHGAALDHLSTVPRVIGVRHNIQGTPKGTCLDARFVRGVQAVGARGYVFDLCPTADQLGDVAALIDRCPETRLVLDHCGKPAVRNDAFDDWARDIERIASFGNVSCKLSGILTEARADQRNASTLAPYVSHLTQCFGATRLLYGSNWPVSTLSGELSLWRSIVDELTSSWTHADRQLLFAGNAIRMYRLPLHANS